MFLGQVTLSEAKEKEPSEERGNHYHTIDYKVSESKTKNAQFRSRDVLPESYDARAENYVTDVKDQNPFGSCWTFSAMSTAETSVLKNELICQNCSWHISFIIGRMILWRIQREIKIE